MGRRARESLVNSPDGPLPTRRPPGASWWVEPAVLAAPRPGRPCHHGGMSPGIYDWFAPRIPERWNARGLEVVADQDEILVLVDLAPGPPGGDGAPGEGPV